MRFCARLFLDELNPRSAGERDRARGEPRAKRDFFSRRAGESGPERRVRSWLRMNAGGAPNTCKSNG